MLLYTASTVVALALILILQLIQSNHRNKVARYEFLKKNAEEIVTLDLNDLTPLTKSYLGQTTKLMAKRYVKDSNPKYENVGTRLLEISVKLKKNEQLNDIEKKFASKYWTDTISQLSILN